MEVRPIDEATTWLEKANAGLEPELMTKDGARELLGAYARVRRLVDFGIAQLTRKVDDAGEVARVTGTSLGRAKDTVATGAVLRDSDTLSAALESGEVSLEQACEIAKAEDAAPGSAEALVDVARNGTFSQLKNEATRVKLDAEQHRGLAQRQRAARGARTYADDLGMVHLHVAWEPHVGTPIVNRAEAEAGRLYRAAKKDGTHEPFERHLADAYAALLSGAGTTARARRAEVVVLVSHSVATRGWSDVRDGEVCKIPGVGPVAPQVAKEIARDAFISGLFYDGTDLRHFKRWTRNIPVEVRTALELGAPPHFDGIRCVDCGNRFRIENDHVEPHAAGGPAAVGNFEHRCTPCHEAKTERDRKAGKLKPPDT